MSVPECLLMNFSGKMVTPFPPVARCRNFISFVANLGEEIVIAFAYP